VNTLLHYRYYYIISCNTTRYAVTSSTVAYISGFSDIRQTESISLQIIAHAVTSLRGCSTSTHCNISRRVANRPEMAGTVPELTPLPSVPCPGLTRICTGIVCYCQLALLTFIRRHQPQAESTIRGRGPIST